MTRNRDLNGYLSLRVRVRLNISGLLVKGQIVYLFLSYYLPPSGATSRYKDDLAFRAGR